MPILCVNANPLSELAICSEDNFARYGLFLNTVIDIMLSTLAMAKSAQPKTIADSIECTLSTSWLFLRFVNKEIIHTAHKAKPADEFAVKMPTEYNTILSTLIFCEENKISYSIAVHKKLAKTPGSQNTPQFLSGIRVI